MPSLEFHPGSNSLSDGLKSLENYTLGVLGKSLDKTEVNLIVKSDDVQSGVSMTSSDSSKSYRFFYLRESTVILDKFLYKLHVEDEGYFSNYSDYSKTSKDLRHQSAKLHQPIPIWTISHVFFMRSRQPLQDMPT